MIRLRVQFQPDSKVEPEHIDAWEVLVADDDGDLACVASFKTWAKAVQAASLPDSAICSTVALYRSAENKEN